MAYLGGCQCGRVRYQVTGDPIRQVFCYCAECQARTGSDKWFGIWYPYSQFSLVQGQTHTCVRKGSSGQAVEHHFCADCGVTLYADITAGQFYTIAATSFDQPELFTPQLAIFTASAQPWAVLPHDIPVFEQLPPEMGG